MNKKQQRQAVRDKSGGRCWYCGEELQDRWCVDHLKPIYRGWPEETKPAHAGLDVMENKVPSCAPCNLAKGAYSVDEFRENISVHPSRVEREDSRFRISKRFGLIEVIKKPVIFWFEHQR